MIQTVKIRVISLWQPWASLVVCGLKKFETRSWAPKCFGPIAIHAAQKWSKLQADLCQTEPFETAINSIALSYLPFGSIVGVVSVGNWFNTEDQQLKNYLASHPDEEAFGDYGKGRFAWQLSEAYFFKNPVEEKGHQGYWSIETKRLPELDWPRIIG